MTFISLITADVRLDLDLPLDPRCDVGDDVDGTGTVVTTVVVPPCCCESVVGDDDDGDDAVVVRIVPAAE